MRGWCHAHKVLLLQNARAIHQHIRHALAALERGRELLRRARFGQVSRQHQHLDVVLRFKLRCQRFQFVGAASNEDEVVACVCEAVS